MIFCEVAHVDADIFHDLRCSLETRGYHLGRVGSEMTEDGLGDLLAWKVGWDQKKAHQKEVLKVDRWLG